MCGSLSNIATQLEITASISILMIVIPSTQARLSDSNCASRRRRDSVPPSALSILLPTGQGAALLRGRDRHGGYAKTRHPAKVPGRAARLRAESALVRLHWHLPGSP